MNIIPYLNEIDEYLKEDDVIDYGNEAIAQLADINEDVITCAASEVLNAGHGICFAKSHLLAALLRCKSVPTGF